jgi:uncharacterized protein YifE (UPF0438 family)
MKVSRAIAGFFSREELTLLRTMGDRLEKLSKGKVAPADAFERRFVTALKETGSRVSGGNRAARTWRNYKALQKLVDEKELAQLKAQSAAKKLDVEQASKWRLEDRIKELTKQLNEQLTEQRRDQSKQRRDQKKTCRTLAGALKKAMARKAPKEWSTSVFAELPLLEQKALKEHGWLFLLRELKWITQEDFEQICSALRLSSALAYDEKARMARFLEERRNARRVYPRHAAQGLQPLERCAACGRPIIDFRCGCSE